LHSENTTNLRAIILGHLRRQKSLCHLITKLHTIWGQHWDRGYTRHCQHQKHTQIAMNSESIASICNQIKIKKKTWTITEIKERCYLGPQEK
jgi:hypothetical protein